MKDSILNRNGFSDLEEASEYHDKHGGLNFQVRKRPMYVIRGAWNAQAPDTNHDILGWGLDRLPLIPSILISRNHGCLYFGTPGQCHEVRDLAENDTLIGYWGTSKKGLVPIFQSDINHYIEVPTKRRNPYPSKYELDRDNIIKHVDYKW